MSGFRWVCPHCEHAAFLTSENTRRDAITSTLSSGDGNWAISAFFTACPNPECKLTTVTINFGNGYAEPHGGIHWQRAAQRIRLRPTSYARPMPEYVPQAIREDYQEACAILDLSPKAAATLARRALQGLIRGFHGVSRATLAQEIEAIREKVDPLVWQAIDAVRGVGNIGAHMEKDINTIVDVEPDEAIRLVRLIELLVKEWYVARHNREQELAAIIALNASKQEQRRLAQATGASGEEVAANPPEPDGGVPPPPAES